MELAGPLATALLPTTQPTPSPSKLTASGPYLDLCGLVGELGATGFGAGAKRICLATTAAAAAAAAAAIDD